MIFYKYNTPLNVLSQPKNYIYMCYPTATQTPQSHIRTATLTNPSHSQTVTQTTPSHSRTAVQPPKPPLVTARQPPIPTQVTGRHPPKPGSAVYQNNFFFDFWQFRMGGCSYPHPKYKPSQDLYEILHCKGEPYLFRQTFRNLVKVSDSDYDVNKISQ